MKYDYECPSCQEVIEIDKSFTEAQRKEYCPKCKQELIRLFGVMKIVTGGMKSE